VSGGFDILEKEPERIESSRTIRAISRRASRRRVSTTGMSETPITPVIVGEAAMAHRF